MMGDLMSNRLDTMTERIGRRLILFAGIVLLVSAAVKFAHPAKAVNYMALLGYRHEKLFLIAVIELAIGVLFVYRRTHIAGAMLVSAYFGGAIAAHLAEHPLTGTAPFVVFNFHHPYLGTLPALAILVCAWAALWLRHPELFRSDRVVFHGSADLRCASQIQTAADSRLNPAVNNH